MSNENFVKLTSASRIERICSELIKFPARRRKGLEIGEDGQDRSSVRIFVSAVFSIADPWYLLAHPT